MGVNMGVKRKVTITSLGRKRGIKKFKKKRCKKEV